MKWRVFGAFLAVGVLWGSAWTLVPSLPEPPMLAGAARFAIAAALLGVIATFHIKANRNGDRQAFPWVRSVVLGVTLTGLPFAFAVWARDSVSVGVVAVQYAAMPLATVFFGQRRGDVAGAIPAMAIGMGGVAFLAGQGIDTSARQLGGMLLLGAGVALGACSLNYAKRHIRRGQIFQSAAIQCAVASVLLLFLSGTGGIPSPVHWSGASVASLTTLAAVEGAIAFPLLFWLLSMTEAWQTACLQWLTTLVAVAEGGALLREKPSVQMSLGALMVVGAWLWLMKPGEIPNYPANTVTLQMTKRPERVIPSSDTEGE